MRHMLLWLRKHIAIATKAGNDNAEYHLLVLRSPAYDIPSSSSKTYHLPLIDSIAFKAPYGACFYYKIIRKKILCKIITLENVTENLTVWIPTRQINFAKGEKNET